MADIFLSAAFHFTNKIFFLVNNFQVRKERLGDRITALHQIVSPFGKVNI
jgi:hypothetical protein